DDGIVGAEKLERYVHRRAGCRAEEPAHRAILGRYLTVNVPVMPSSRCPVMVQTITYLPGARLTVSFSDLPGAKVGVPASFSLFFFGSGPFSTVRLGTILPPFSAVMVSPRLTTTSEGVKEYSSSFTLLVSAA